MNMMEKYSKMLEIVREHNGEYFQGHSRDRITFWGENHRETAEKVFNACRDLDINVYGLRHIKGWEDKHNKVEAHSEFEYR